MQRSRVLKYVLDIEAIIQEIELVLSKFDSFEKFKESVLSKRTIERDLEIIGEAANHLLKLDPKINISGIQHIIGLRNIISHMYDSVDEVFYGV